MSSSVESGSIEVRDASVVCRKSDREAAWSIPISQIILIAEYTSNEGPYRDDYLLVFVSIQDGKAWFAKCSFYAGGMDEVLAVLEKEFGVKMELGLLGSTQWDSRVIWPPDLAGHKYFEFTKVIPKRLSERIRQTLLGDQLEYRIAEPIRAYIQERLKLIS